MFIYKNGRFNFGNVSFALPDGMAVETANCDVVLDGFLLCSLDESFEVSIDCSSDNISAHDDILGICNEDTGYNLIRDITPISYGGLNGYMAVYENEDTINEEYIFDTPNGGEYDLLDIFVSIEKGNSSYDEAYKNRVVSEILNNIISLG